MEDTIKALALETIERYARWYVRTVLKRNPDNWRNERIDFEPVAHLTRYMS